MLKTLKMFAVMLTAVLTIGTAQAQDRDTCESDVSAEYSHLDTLYLEFDVAPEDAAPLPEDATCGSELEALQGEVDRAHDLIDPPVQASQTCIRYCSVCGACLQREPEEPFDIITKNAAVSVIG